jgi:3-deoxy-D-manno-octulosonic acid kinase
VFREGGKLQPVKKGTKTLTESVEKTATGAILFDQSIIKNISESMFVSAGWPHAEAVAGQLQSAGRGQTLFVGNVPRQFVLRHFVRGGLIGKLVRDSYLFTGADNTRSFLEWRMLAKMAENNLRVPRPAAARYCQRGPFYSADIITVRIPRVRALSERISEKAWDETFWRALGTAIHEFHDCGVYHADMNAYNLQIDDNGVLWMLDFDRGRLQAPGAWQQKTLERLHRSLQKVKRLDPRLHYGHENWEQLLEGYFRASRSE